jgi:hypothetical protein
MNRFTKIGLMGSIAIFVVGVFGVVAIVWQDYWESVTDHSAAMSAAHSIIRYVQNNDAQPRSWNDLEPGFDQIKYHYGFSSIDQVQARILIQFDELANRESRAIIQLRCDRLTKASLNAANEWLVREQRREE